ncbi:metallophosphoesterase [Tannockella kyphosi]|uniref:metallophosphoesterase n=1 Tax=Tannockella kyphosi TaxID=2899121 RepID=UPI00201264B0|nr:metallophosphoesterase [Tannockella kyphosi]
MRRKLRILKALVCIIIVMSLGFAIYNSYYIAPTTFKVVNYEIYDEKISDDFNGFTIGFISDLNIHTIEDLDKLEEIVTTCNELDFDFIIFGGDLFDTTIFDEDVVVELLTSITSNYGKFAILGEKDILYSTSYLLTQSGFEVLQNDYRTIYKEDSFIRFFGLEANDSMDGLLSGTDDTTFSFVAIHQPDYFSTLQEYDIDLQLSGHSNGGYINLPFIGSLVTKDLATIYTTGLYYESNTTLIVSNGLNNESDIDYRFNTPCQIVSITLTNQ